MADERLIDKEKFRKRLKKIYDFMSEDKHALITKADAISIVYNDEDLRYSKGEAIQLWLFGYKLLDALIVLCRNGAFFLASKNKAAFLQPAASEEAEDGLPPITVLTRNKADKDAANFAKILEAIKGSRNGKVLGEFPKEKAVTDFAKQWRAVVSAEAEFEMLDVSIPFALILAPKDDLEISSTRNACVITANLWNKYLKGKIVDIVDQEKRVRHETLAEECEKQFSDRKIVGGLNLDHVESSYPPIIQSGPKCALKFSVISDKQHVLVTGAVLCSLGGRYRGYCCNVARTIVVQPHKDCEAAFELLIRAEQALIDALRPGAQISEAYTAAVDVVKESRPELVEQMAKSFGFVTGLEFRESTLLIGPKNVEKVEEGMVFIVHIGFAEVPNRSAKDDKAKTVALLMSDTILIGKDSNEVLTDACKRKAKSTIIRLEESADKEEDANKENIEQAMGRGKRSVVLQETTRNKMTGEDKRREHQKELAKQVNDRAKERLSSARSKVDETKAKKSNSAYKSMMSIPNEREVRSLQIFVDKRHDAVLLPIFGVPVPFHISMIKSVSLSAEGDTSYLRVNFSHPGSSIMSKDAQNFVDPTATFLKEISYRSTNLKEAGEINPPSMNLNAAHRLIKELQKRYKTQEAEAKEKEGLVKQDKLLMSQNKANPKLKDVLIRPQVITGKRIAGYLEAHHNGFRYTSMRGDKVDILYNNIKHAFFQPCDKELIVLLHFHLKHEVLFGKKKHKDIQFFTEVGEITTDLNKYHHMQDRDDAYGEQAERELRGKLNAAFRNFCEKVERLTANELDFDTPFRDLGFTGVPYRSSVLLQPTSGAVVNLTEWPPLVITMDEVELVHCERVNRHLKNFDMVFVFKDYNRKPQMIQQIPMDSLDHIKQWLDSYDIRYTEGLQSLNWAKIMKTIVDDPEEFFTGGGWNFLGGASDDEDEEEDDSDEGDDVYQPSDDSDVEEEEEDSDDTASSPDPTSDDDSEAGVESDESSGKDWSDLEEEARKADRQKETEEISGVPSSSKGPDKYRSKHHASSSHRDKDKHRKRKAGDDSPSPKRKSKGAPPSKRHK